MDSKGKIYEWDKQHGALEVYDKTGKKHLGEFDPKTGKQTKPGDLGRSTPK
ncbi:colicin E3/pyocin S6 family cytotoxin [Paramesorhizobium deserti]|uniref:colicin E3/pyocin S6 family cytotoxin n=1 Tax=Paramesorhizobium deserti TaxID=1494590 RepID=UPI0009E77267|nr:colicin E3/pyocin S6 family cytotoxin [Paramesorhizobium deserti]